MAAPGGAGIVGVGTLSTKVDLMLAADKLPSADLLSKADPFVMVEKRVGAAWVEIGRTEVVDNNNSPTYVSVVSWWCGVVWSGHRARCRGCSMRLRSVNGHAAHQHCAHCAVH
jgi:hypothetical protein